MYDIDFISARNPLDQREMKSPMYQITQRICDYHAN